jgi:hypothetical protein
LAASRKEFKEENMILKNRLFFVALTMMLAIALAVPTYAGGKGDQAEKAQEKRADMDRGHVEIDVDELPAQIRTEVETNYPDADIEEVVRVGEGNAQVFRIKIEDDQAERFLMYNPSGNLIEINESIDEEELPQAIKATLDREYPDVDIEEVDKVVKDGVTTWEVIVDHQDRKMLVTLDNNGAVLSTDMNVDEDREDRNIGDQGGTSGY